MTPQVVLQRRGEFWLKVEGEHALDEEAGAASGLGVSAAVAKALKAIDRAKGVQLEVRGPVLPDSKVVPVPGRLQDDYDDAIER